MGINVILINDQIKEKKMKPQAPKQITLIIAIILWVIGVLSTVLGVFSLPNDLGLWSLIVAGLLLILGCLIKGI
jgi:uncharacterized membrane protein HdeD (DUF308 family)